MLHPRRYHIYSSSIGGSTFIFQITMVLHKYTPFYYCPARDTHTGNAGRHIDKASLSGLALFKNTSKNVTNKMRFGQIFGQQIKKNKY